MTPGAAPGRAADPARTVFFGSGAFAVPLLAALEADPNVRLVGVVTTPDRPSGRGKLLVPTPVALRARASWVPLLQPARVRAPESIAEIAALEPELGVLADYGQIVPQELFDLPSRGILNAHPSLLPRHRGATPIPAAIAAGDAETGVSIIRMDAGIDTGPIVASRSWPLDGDTTSPALEARAANAAAALLAEILPAWLAGGLPPVPQDEAAATLTRPFRRSDGRLDPKRPAAELERLVRALKPWPGTFLETELGRVSVHRASVADATPDDGEPGRLVGHDGRLALITASGRLVLEEVQREGRRATPGAEFLRGQAQLVGTLVGAKPTPPTADAPTDQAEAAPA